MQVMHTGEKVDNGDQRYKSSGRVVRLVYSLLVISVLSYAIYFFGRPYVVLEGMGTVTAPMEEVSVAFVSTVDLVHVRPGDQVYPGTLLATVTRADYSEALSEAAEALANREQDIDRVQRELIVAERVRPTLQQRLDELSEIMENANAQPDMIDLTTRTMLYREYSDALAQVEENRARLTQLPVLLEKLLENQKDLEARQAEIAVTWPNRQLLADRAGIISSGVVTEGSSVVAGEVMMHILDDDRRHVVWELPDNMLRLPRLGERVVIQGVGIEVSGWVDRFALVSDLDGFTSDEKRRMVYVTLDEDPGVIEKLPLQSSVTVRLNYFLND